MENGNGNRTGKWIMEYGKWKLEIENGNWKLIMDNGKWKMEN